MDYRYKRPLIGALSNGSGLVRKRAIASSWSGMKKDGLRLKLRNAAVGSIILIGKPAAK